MAYDIGPTVGVLGEQEFKKAMSGIGNEFKLLGSEMKLSASQFAKNDKSMGALSAQSKVLGKEIDTQKGKISLITEQYDKQSAKLTELKAKLDATKAAFAADSDEVARARNEYNQQNTTVIGLNTQLNNATATLNKMDAQLAANAKNIALQNSNWTKLGKSLDTIGTKMKTVGDGMTNVGKTLSMSVTAPVVALGVAAVKTGMDYEAAMSRVKAISGATTEEFQKLNDQALQLGQDTAFSAKEAAQGMENLASAGMSVNEIMTAMPGMLALAASGGIEIAEASEIASGALVAFGLDASKSGHVADVLAKAAADTNAGVTDMGMALKYAAAPANALGMSVEEVAAAVGTMSNANIKGEQSGTTLRGSLIALASPSSAAADAMEDIGFNAFDAQGKMLPFADVIGNLKTATADLTDEQKANALATIFGREAISGMMVLVDAGPESLSALTQSFVDSTGAADAMATTMQDNTKSSIEQMTGSLETAAIKIEQSLAPTITELALLLQDLADDFSNLSPEMQGTIIKAVAIVAAIGPVLTIFGTLTKSVGVVTTGFGMASQAIGVATTGATAATPAIASMAAAFTALTGPVAIAIVGIAAISAVFIGITQDSRDATNAVTAVTDAMNVSNDASNDSIAAAEAESTATRNMADDLFALADQESKTNEQKAEMQGLVESLNKSVPNLNLAYDAQTDALNKNKDSVYDLIDAKMDEIKLSAYADKLKNDYANQAKQAELYTAALKRFNDAKKAFNTYTPNAIEGIQRTAEYYEASEAIIQVCDASDKTEESLKASKEAYAALAGDASKAGSTLTAEAQAQKKAVDDAAASTAAAVAQSSENLTQYYEDLEKAAQDHQSEMGSIDQNGIDQSKETAKEWKANLDQQIIDMQSWRTNMLTLSRELPAEFLEYLRELGPGEAQIIQDLVDGSPEERAAAVETWREWGRQAKNAAIDELGKAPGEASMAGANAGFAFVTALNASVSGIKVDPVSIPVKYFGSKMDLPKLPGFAVGSRYLPSDMLIQAHQGEMIVPKSENPYANSGGNILSSGTQGTTKVEHRFPDPLVIEGYGENGDLAIRKVIDMVQKEKWFSGT